MNQAKREFSSRGLIVHTVNSKEVQTIIEIVENFIKKKDLICYGGTAINNILPKEDQF